MQFHSDNFQDILQEKKKLLKTEAEKDQALLNKSSLDIKLVPEDSSDKKMAELLKYRTVICMYYCL